jgi:hypothetical protein
VLREEIRNARNSGTLELVVANARAVSTYKINYRDGEKYPYLERNNQPPLLDEILRPLTK